MIKTKEEKGLNWFRLINCPLNKNLNKTQIETIRLVQCSKSLINAADWVDRTGKVYVVECSARSPSKERTSLRERPASFHVISDVI